MNTQPTTPQTPTTALVGIHVLDEILPDPPFFHIMVGFAAIQWLRDEGVKVFAVKSNKSA